MTMNKTMYTIVRTDLDGDAALIGCYTLDIVPAEDAENTGLCHTKEECEKIVREIEREQEHINRQCREEMFGEPYDCNF
jgi:hypothetical protein